MMVNDTANECSLCSLGPPPDMILRIPPPPMPSFLMRASDYFISGTGPGANAGAPGANGGGANAGVASSASPGANEPEDGPADHFDNGAPCRHTCDWRAEGVRYVEVPQQGTFLDDTWFIVLISACVGVVFVGIILATFMYKCKLEPEVAHPNDDASQCSNRSNKNSTLSTSTASSGMQTTTTSGGPCSKLGLPRLQSEAVLYPCAHHQQHDALSDSRVMWATLTPRGTTRHYVEEHTYETIGATAAGSPIVEDTDGTAADASTVDGVVRPPEPTLPPPQSVGSLLRPPGHRRRYTEAGINEHTYSEPPAVPAPPIPTRPKDEKAFDNTAFVDYEDPHQMKNEYYQLEDVLEPCDPIFSVQGLYSMQPRRNSSSSASGTLRPRVSSPMRIEHPNLPPLNLQPSLKRNKQQRKNSFHQPGHHLHHHSHHHNHHQQQTSPQQAAPGDCTILRSGMTSPTTYIPTI
ncbi:uncharacterized protein LOC106642227 [Copidosoma floridanum]|uniref:uncharacterized protein LOC106642227 n=1 Tax=Copidosoma floridanum TaxID=29053 RepID=UPI0006C94528|nr:uncharacterized protein LOC106642227 [Copidosoma floridanum]